MNVLAVGAHHDDIELGCGGTLARLAGQGHRTFGLTLTNSETHDDIQGIHRTSAVARAEAERAAAVLGLTLVELEGFGQDNGTLTYEVGLDETHRALHPRPGYFAGPVALESRFNTDHEAAAKLTIVASRHVPSLLMYRSNWYQPAEPFNGTFFVDISETADLKRRSLECFRSELENRKRAWLESFFDSHRTAGFSIGRQYAEVFEPIRYELLSG